MSYDTYPDGSILQISFHNFLTYEDTVCTPGENLNLILGHNGSGKSSIICGICLVFGGSPKSLGRSEKLPDYIRHNCTEAFVEVMIADKQKGPQIIRLNIRKGKSPEYKLNGNHSTQQQIKDLAKSYNIQIDNPCAFLAQDKVKSFSEQSPIELLFNTEKAASAETHEEHIALIQQRKDSSQIEDKCNSSIKAIQQIEENIAKLEPRVENYRKKKQMQNKLRLLEQKLSMVEFNEVDDEYRKEVEEFDEIKENYDKIKDKVSKVDAKRKKLSSMADTERNMITKHKSKAADIIEKIEGSIDKDIISNRTKQAKRELDAQKKAFDQNEREKEETIRRIRGFEEKLDEAEIEMKGYQKFMEKSKSEEKKLFEIEKECRNHEDSISKKGYDLRSLLEKQREADKHNAENETRRLRCMGSLSPDAAKAWNYYKANRSAFKDDIFVPIMHVTLTTPDAAKYIENSVGGRDWCMFVCSNKDDELIINDNTKGWRINSTVVRKESVNTEQINSILPDELKQYGFSCFVSESISAPDSLKQYLCNVFQLHRIACGKNEVEKNLGNVADSLAKTRYNVFITTNIRVQISISRYSGEVMQSQSQLRQPQTWNDQVFSKSTSKKSNTGSIDEELDKMNAEIKKETEVMNEKRRNIQKAKDSLKVDQNEWRQKKQVENAARQLVEAEKDRLKRLEKEVIDLDKAEKAFEKAQIEAKKSAQAMFDECIKSQTIFIDIHEEIARSALIELQCRKKYNEESNKLSNLRDKEENLKCEKESAEYTLQQAHIKRKTACESMKDKCQLKHLDLNKMDNIEKQIFEKLMELFKEAQLPEEKDQVEKQLNAERTRLRVAENSSDDGNIDDERRMDKLKAELIEEISRKDKLIETKKNVHDKLSESIEIWKQKVNEMIEKINENYRDNFIKMGCLGEVHLEIPENKLDIDNYGIMIMVCFRNGEKLKRLDQRVQSGGERSVATMLYLLALQQLCPVPFRCVDEINQGMDPTNERKVFEIMVNLWSGTGALAKTQYFLLTPKLLHGLSMNERVTVQVVHSVVPKKYSDWDTTKFLEATRAKCAV
ncbi:unnamed protein product [Caenorhabditis angaria]|uniref:Structural maintenance of chromosomes protein 5 n=1 Tax=Caenorhabditis angaria TaxID=860376 RepID=A0A9P1MVV7_9PELO|nr:unnamed protein product [Caenorhabditis angaria]